MCQIARGEQDFDASGDTSAARDAFQQTRATASLLVSPYSTVVAASRKFEVRAYQ